MKLKILNNIKPAQEFIPLPDLSIFNLNEEIKNLDLVKSRAEETGISFYEIKNNSEINSIIQTKFPKSINICDTTDSLNIGTIDHGIKDKSILDHLDICIVKAQFIVEENAAVWIAEEDIKNRILLCIPEHLVVLVDKSSIIGNMHDAFLKINKRNNNYGVFVCGPSKTADIAQTLVIGAHGPKSMTVIIDDHK